MRIYFIVKTGVNSVMIFLTSYTLIVDKRGCTGCKCTSNLDTGLAGEEEQLKNPINRQAGDFTNDDVFICFPILGTVHQMFL